MNFFGDLHTALLRIDNYAPNTVAAAAWNIKFKAQVWKMLSTIEILVQI